MDYVLYTSNAEYYDFSSKAWKYKQIEFVYYTDADYTSVITEVYGPNDSMQSLSFWLGPDHL